MRFTKFVARSGLATLIALSSSPALPAADTAAITVEQDPSGAVLHNGSETLRLSVCGPGLLHIIAGPGECALPWA